MQENIVFQKADAERLPVLRSIAYHSEAHWGYDPLFMETFQQKFNITETFLTNHPVYAGSLQGTTVGFWGLQHLKDRPGLEYFYITPEYLSRGLGKIMWMNLTAWCRENGIFSFEFVTSPQAVGFYEKMGAVITGEKQSSIDGRQIPQLQYKLQGSRNEKDTEG